MNGGEILANACAAMGIALGEGQLKLFEVYAGLLEEANRQFNLTRVTGPEIFSRHFADSLLLSQAVQLRSGLRMVDIGSGAGFPGLPLKILEPGLKVTLLESVAKKAFFLRRLVEELGLGEVEVLACRAEEVGRRPGYREGFDLAVARAVASLPVLVEYSLPFLKVGGAFLAAKGPAVTEELPGGAKAASLLGGRLAEVKRLLLNPTGEERHLVLFAKEAPTPEKYPRRPGAPAKKPLA